MYTDHIELIRKIYQSDPYGFVVSLKTTTYGEVYTTTCYSDDDIFYYKGIDGKEIIYKLPQEEQQVLNRLINQCEISDDIEITFTQYLPKGKKKELIYRYNNRF